MSRILLVEDERHLADGLRFNLEAEGYQVEVVETGEEALEVLMAGPSPYDVMVLDVMLPGKDGFKVMSELHRAWSCGRCTARLRRGSGRLPHQAVRSRDSECAHPWLAAPP